MSKLLKKQLVELARSAKVRVTQRVNKKIIADVKDNDDSLFDVEKK
jgi:hypothetical protein